MRVTLLSCSSPPPPSASPQRKQLLYHSVPHSFLQVSSSRIATSASFLPDSVNNNLARAISCGVSVIVSLGIFISSPLPSVALEAVSLSSNQPSALDFSSELNADCRENEENAEKLNDSPLVTNESIVMEAWQIVYDSFLDTSSGRRWSPETWLQLKGDLLGASIQTRSKAHDMIQRMLKNIGDRYTRFLTPAELSRMARYDMTGVGINLREIPDDNGVSRLKVLGLLLDGPAHNAGVRQGDELLFVNRMDVRGKSAFEASSLLLGPSGTTVKITVKHGNCGPMQSIDIERQSVAKTPVFYRLEQTEKNGMTLGYVHLKEFNALAKKDLVTAIKRLQDMGATYFVLDLRDNLGGLVQAGIEIAKIFLNEGETVTYTVGRDPQYVQNITAEAPPLVTAPVIVLVNKNTASASEIVATALHDNCRAALVGDQTYGKGLIQSVFELHDGSGISVTVGKYVTPNHKDINGNGVEPDFRNMPSWTEAMKVVSQCHRPKD